ncbi:site-2 protease family protein [Acetobacteraceae bacterium]|nr:site-2 protease family protein [Candidatus Parcubacteria bacterium]
MSLLIFIGILIALILVHELGHFVVAKLFGIRVDEFGIFFPPRIFAKKFGETEYSLNSLPFGGFVKIFGENGNEGERDKRSFVNKPRYAQALVIVAGIVMNLVFAWLILSVGYMAGLPTSVEHQGFGTVSDPHIEIVAVLPESPAMKAGIEAGDSIKAVGTASIEPFYPETADGAQTFIASHQDDSIIVIVAREGELKNFVVRASEGLIEGRKALGIQMNDVGVLQLPPHVALAQGGLLAYNMTIATAEGLSQFFTTLVRGTANFSEVAGPIGIANIGAGAVQSGFVAAITLTAIISINLALINILPIPGLDGGRLLIIAIEGTIRRAVPQRVTLSLTIAGFALLILLMVVVSYHDIARLIG